MVKKIFPFLIFLLFAIPAFAVDIDEALPHYGPALAPMAFSNGVIFIPILVIGVDMDEALPHYGPSFNGPALPIDTDAVLGGGWLPIMLTIDPDEALPHYGPLNVFGVLIDPDEALPHYIWSGMTAVDPDEAMPHYAPPLMPCGPAVDPDEAMPYYGPVKALFSNPDLDIVDIWLPIVSPDIDEVMPHYSPASCFSIDNSGNLCLTFFLNGGFWAAPIKEMAPIDMDEALPHY